MIFHRKLFEAQKLISKVNIFDLLCVVLTTPDSKTGVENENNERQTTQQIP